MMTTISDKDRAEAGRVPPPVTIGPMQPTTERMTLGYYRHPSMDGQHPCHECGHVMHEHGWLDTGGDGIAVCPSEMGPFGGQTVTERGRNHECPTVPVWRPTTFDEIQPGWEVRARDVGGEPLGWGTAHERGPGGSWYDPDGNIIGYLGWAYETTAPLPEPEPWDEALVEDVVGAIYHYDGCSNHELARSVLDLLAERGLVELPKAGA